MTLLTAKTLRKRLSAQHKVPSLLAGCIALLMANPLLACESQTLTELEAAYCTLKNKGLTKTLPDFYQFKQNPESIQWLLLKAPARKAGLTLPAKPQKQQSVTKQASTNKPASPPSPTSQPPASNESKLSSQNTNFLDGCSLQKDVIQCPSSSYKRIYNQQNSQLQHNALATSNTLKLPPFTDHIFQSERHYLSKQYPKYVEKMLSIGLPEAVMSYTKFVTQYELVNQQGGEFEKRMAQMFEILKQEKRARKVRPRYLNTSPKSIEQCLQITRPIIVCDDVSHTWTYIRFL